MSAQRRQSGEIDSSCAHICPEHDRIGDLEKRVGMLDGNGKDPSGGRMGRAETRLDRHDGFIDEVNEMLNQFRGASKTVKVVIVLGSLLGGVNVFALVKVLMKVG